MAISTVPLSGTLFLTGTAKAGSKSLVTRTYQSVPADYMEWILGSLRYLRGRPNLGVVETLGQNPLCESQFGPRRGLSLFTHPVLNHPHIGRVVSWRWLVTRTRPSP